MAEGAPRVLLLGPVRVEIAGSYPDIRPKTRLLAARLALAGSKVVSNDVLIDELWSGEAPTSARKIVQKYVWEIRSVLGEKSIVTEGPGYRLEAGSDVAEVERLVGEGRDAMSAGMAAKAAPLFKEALEMYRGRPLQGLDDVPFVADESRRLEELRFSIEEELAEAELALGRDAAAAERLERLVSAYPMRERTVAALMTALYRSGRHADALAVFRRHSHLLGEELGLAPGPQLTELEERILIHDRSLRSTLVEPPGHPARPSIAVLPFADLSPDQDQAYFADGVAVEVIRMLSRLEDLRVASRGSSFAYRTGSFDVRRVGVELGVTSVLEGIVRRHHDRVRITVGLTDTLDGFQLWSETYDRGLDDIFRIQEEIAASVVEALSVRLDRTVAIDSVAPGTAAYELYLQGRHHFFRGGLTGTRRAIDLFEEAIRVAPNYCLALAGLADACSFLHLYYERNSHTLECAEVYGRRSVDVDPTMAETHAALGFALGAASRYDDARSSFAEALLHPGGRFESTYLFGRTLFCEGDMEVAVEMFTRAVEIRSEDFHAAAFLGKTLLSTGQEERSVVMQQRVLDLVVHHLRLVPDDARAIGDGARALVALGRSGEALVWAERALDMKHGPMSYYAAGVLALADRPDRAFDAMEGIIEAGWSHRDFLLHDPDWAGLRDHPRFAALIDRLS